MTLIVLLFLVLSFGGPAHLEAAPTYDLTLENSIPRQDDIYTQGLFFHNGDLYESSGLYDESIFIRWNFKSGEPLQVRQIRPLPETIFAEGAALAEGEVYLLSWREEQGFVLDPESLLIKRFFAYSGQGWGLAWDGARLWRSDGSARLYPHRAGDFAPAGEPVIVRDGEKEINQLNELEWDAVTGLLLANIYGEDMVAAIDLNSGQVAFWLDARPLRARVVKDGLSQADSFWNVVLNGLALEGSSLWLTGKYWPRIYQVAWPPEGYKRP